jgi:hypothetical protein
MRKRKQPEREGRGGSVSSQRWQWLPLADKLAFGTKSSVEAELKADALAPTAA